PPASGTCAGARMKSSAAICGRAASAMNYMCGASRAITIGRGGGPWRVPTWFNLIPTRRWLFHPCRSPSLHPVAMGLDGLLRQANQVGHAAVGNLRHLLAEFERPSRHGDAHGKWGVAVKLFGSGEQRRRIEVVSQAAGTGLRRNGDPHDGSGLLSEGGIQKQHEVPLQYVVHHLRGDLLGGDPFHVGIVPEMLLQRARGMTA